MSAVIQRALVGAAIVACASGGYFLLRAAPSAKKASLALSSGSAGLDELKGRVAELEQAMASNGNRYSALQPRVERVEVPVAPARSPHDSADHGGLPPPRLTEEQVRELEARRTQRFEELLQSEPRDRSWAPGYEASLRDAVQATTQGDGAAAIETLSCRTSLCRLEVSSASSGAQRQFMGGLHAHLPPMAAVHWTVAPGDDGSSRTTLDFVRAGYPTEAIDGPID